MFIVRNTGSVNLSCKQMADTSLEEFVYKTTQLLKLERDAEISENKLLLENRSLKELQRRGVCLTKLRLSERQTGLYGRTLLVFTSFWPGKDLPSHSFSPGDLAGVGASASPAREVIVSGLVARASSVSVSVALEEGQEDAADSLDESVQYKLVKLANDVTYQRIKKGLKTLNNYSSGPAQNLINVLFNVSEPGPPLSAAWDYASKTPVEFYNTGLDETQKEAVRFSLQQRELAIVHGPPGTGKTTTLVEIIRHAASKKLKVLACAPSNTAVDNLVERLGAGGVGVVRLGHPARLLPATQRYSLDALLSASEGRQLVRDVRADINTTLGKLKKARGAGERSALRQDMRALRRELRTREENATRDLLKHAQVVLSTLTGISDACPLRLLDEQHFDVVVIDECSQALEAACWLPLVRAPRCILAGDHHQLPPTILSTQAASDGLAVTLMERLLKRYPGDLVTRMLTVQYRMHERIMEWSSQQLYEGRLTAHHSVAHHLLKELAGVEETEETSIPLLFIDTAGCDLHELALPDHVSKGNEGEADLVLWHVEKLVESGVAPCDIAVIAPYNMQVELVRQRLAPRWPSLEVRSVDGFQGREKEAVVMTLVRSNPQGMVGFLAESRRINVAVTRARRHLAVIGDSDTVRGDSFMASLIDYLNAHGEVHSAQQYIDMGALNTNFARPEHLDEILSSDGSRQPSGKPASKTPKSAKIRKSASGKGDNRVKGQGRPNYTKPPVPRTQEQLAEEAEVEAKLRAQITQFVNDTELATLSFPTSLTARERFLVHTIAEEFSLSHASQGDGDDRHIVLTKSTVKFTTTPDASLPSTGPQPSNKSETKITDTTGKETQNNIDKEVLKEDQDNIIQDTVEKSDEITPDVSELKISDQTNERTNLPVAPTKPTPVDCIPFSRCSKCAKEVPTSNISLHELRCTGEAKNSVIAKPKDEVGTEASASNEAKKKPKKQKNSKAKGGSKKEGKPEEDFDELMALAQELNAVCNFSGCSAHTSTVGQHCKHCAQRFCLKHHIPEVHGCQRAAHAHARTMITRDGMLYAGSGRPETLPKPEKRAGLQRKLDGALNKMAQQRTRKQQKDK